MPISRTGVVGLLRATARPVARAFRQTKAIAVSTAMSLAVLLTPTSADAVTFMPGSNHTFHFGGQVNGTQVAGLSASLNLNLVSAIDGVFRFQYTLSNSSRLDSRVSSFGFASYPDVSSGGILSGSAGAFTNLIVETGRTKADYPGYKNIDLCLTSGPTCQGGNAGAQENGSALTGLFYLTVANLFVTQLSLTDFAVRYQGINGTAEGVTYSDASGIGTGIVSPVPEPSVWAMLVVCLGLLVRAIRRARRLEVPGPAVA